MEVRRTYEPISLAPVIHVIDNDGIIVISVNIETVYNKDALKEHRKFYKKQHPTNKKLDEAFDYLEAHAIMEINK